MLVNAYWFGLFMKREHTPRVAAKTFGLFLALSLLAAVPVSSHAGEKNPSYVRCDMKFRNGKSGNWNLVNRRLSFGTSAGKVRLWLHELRSMVVSATGKKCTVSTVHGDTWTAEFDDDTIEYYYLDTTRGFKLAEASIEKFTFSPANVATWIPKGYGKIVFENGNVVFADLTDLTLDIDSSLDTWKLPVGSAEMIQFRLSRTGVPVHVLAQFPSGRTEQFRCADGWPWFQATDSFGNKIKVRYRDVNVIRGRENVLENDQSQASVILRAGEEPQTIEVISKEGRTQRTSIPALVWTVKGALGSVLLPSAMLREINSEPEGSGQYAVTVYGECFLGRISPRALSVPIPGRKKKEYARLNVAGQRRIEFGAQESTAPKGHRLFRMRDGDAFYGRFSGEEIRFEMAHKEPRTKDVATRSIAGIHNPDTKDDILTVTMKNDAQMKAEPASSRVEVVLLINGMRCTVRWDDIESVAEHAEKISKQIALSAAAGELHVDTRLGTMALSYPLLHKIYNAPGSAVSCFATVYGDLLVGKRLSRSQFAALSGRKYLKGSSSRVPAEVVLNNAKREAPSNSLAWRLTTGDMFHAQFSKDHINVSMEEGNRKALRIDTAGITAITRVPGKGFEFIGEQGAVTGRPKAGGVWLRLPCLNDAVAVPFTLLEHARRGSPEDLPPPLSIVPGVTHLQEGVVPVQGGSYMMGREEERSGMPDETPRHKVEVTSFCMDACEVTRDQFKNFVDDTGYVTEAEKRKAGQTWRAPGFKQEGDEPVVFVSWHDAVQYCNWRSEEAELDPCYEIRGRDRNVVCDREKNGYRLPTEAEWEFAARNGGKDIEFPWLTAEGGEASEFGKTAAMAVRKANFAQAETEHSDNWLWTNPVKSFGSNKLGLYGMGGNVWEWCQDLYLERAYYTIHKRHPRDPCVDVQSAGDSTRRVIRGGSFANELDMLRCVSRGNGAPHAGANRVGFRCVRRVVP